ncbi:MAG TPA: hypothetical protein VMD59_13715 [Acidimicrobiales bacterium]|nr:hypothetical protein [Acidimicrobiales bacterium]
MWRTESRQRHEARERAAVKELLRETEAFLAGTYAGEIGQRPPLPAWAAVNALAHGSLGTLRGIAGSKADLAAVPDGGTAARLLAREVLNIVEDDEALLRVLQSAVLRPLELELIARSELGRLSAYEVVTTVRNALRAVTGRPPLGPPPTPGSEI